MSKRNKLVVKLVAAIVFLFTILGQTHWVSAAESELMITSLVHKDPLVAGKTVRFEAHVTVDDPKKPTKTLKNEEGVNVYTFFTKGAENREVTLTSKGKGNYEGVIKLPESGTWQVNVMALKIGQGKKLGANNTATIETEWHVQKAGLSAAVWWTIGIAAVLIMLMLIFVLTRLRRKKREAALKKAVHHKKNRR